MTKVPSKPSPVNDDASALLPENVVGEKKLSGAAMRSLAEAQERRSRPAPPAPTEFNGRDGPDPVRYGDWEVKGLASDF